MLSTDYMLYDDQELLLLLRQGNTEAFTTIYDRYWERLFAIAYHYCRQKELAREIVQDIFMGLWDRKNVVDIQSLSAYLATAARFLVFRELKKEYRRKLARERNYHPSNEVSEQSAIEARFLQEFIRGRVEQLPQQCRIVYHYSREHHLSIQQIAQLLHISPKTAENHLSRALRFLRLSLRSIRIWGILSLSLLGPALELILKKIGGK